MLCGTGATEGMSDLDFVLDLSLNVESKSAECIRKHKNKESIASHYMILENRNKVLERDNTGSVNTD